MSDEYAIIINRLRKAIKREDTEKAMTFAKQLIQRREAFRIEAQSPVLCYRPDTDTASQCTAMSIHRLFYDQEEISDWTRQSIGGYGLDRNHPDLWAAVAIDPSMSKYVIVIKPVLQQLGLQDYAPSIPEKK